MHNSAGFLRVENPFETKLLFLPDKLDKLYLLALPIHLSSSSSQELIILLLVEAEDSWECDFDYVMASRDPSRHWENETLFFNALPLWNIKERKHLEWNSIWKQNLIFITVLMISSMQRGGFWRRNCTWPYRPPQVLHLTLQPHLITIINRPTDRLYRREVTLPKTWLISTG